MGTIIKVMTDILSEPMEARNNGMTQYSVNKQNFLLRIQYPEMLTSEKKKRRHFQINKSYENSLEQTCIVKILQAEGV